MATINYIMAAALYDATSSFKKHSDDPTNYDSLIWNTPPILESILEKIWLESEKRKQIAKISEAMNAQVIGGFLSDALSPGKMRKYNSDIQGQTSIIGAIVYLMPSMEITVPASYVFPSYDPITGEVSYDPHTYLQMYKVLTDLGIFSGGLIASLNTKILQIMTVNTGSIHTDLDFIYSVNWP